jgi:hypothetical protein
LVAVELEVVTFKQPAVTVQTQLLIVILQSAVVAEQVMVQMLKLEVQVEVVPVYDIAIHHKN